MVGFDSDHRLLLIKDLQCTALLVIGLFDVSFEQMTTKNPCLVTSAAFLDIIAEYFQGSAFPKQSRAYKACVDLIQDRENFVKSASVSNKDGYLNSIFVKSVQRCKSAFGSLLGKGVEGVAPSSLILNTADDQIDKVSPIQNVL